MGGSRTTVLLIIAGLAVGYGLTRSDIFATREPDKGTADAGKAAVVPGAVGRKDVVAQATRMSDTVSSRARSSTHASPMKRQATPVARPPDFSDRIMFDAEGPTDLPASEAEPIDIGPWVDADDPASWVHDEPEHPPVEIGAYLDADAPPL